MCWDQPSASKWFKEAMFAHGLEPADPADRDEYARQLAHQYMGRYQAMIEPALRPGAAVGVWFNSRPKTRLHEEKQFVRHVEIESLPSGGWGYAYLPYVARFVRPLGLPTLSHTGRFHKSWGDHGALKTTAALKYECCQILSQGLTSGVGDLLHPSGRPNAAVYSLLGGVYGYLEQCEPFVRAGVLASEIAVLVDPELGDAPGPAGVGVVRALQQLRQQFDITGPDADLTPYRLVIVPESTTVDAATALALQAYVAGGGALILSGAAALDASGAPVLPEMGVQTHGASPFSHVYLHLRGPLAVADKPFDTVMYERTHRMTAEPGADVLVSVVEPYFERTYAHFSGHEYTVPDAESEYAAVIKNGSVVTLAAPLLTAFAVHGNACYRELLGSVIDLLMPAPLITDDGPAHLEATVVQVGERTVVHLLSFIPGRLAEGLDLINDPVPVVDLTLNVRRAGAPLRVQLQPAGQDLPFEYSGGYVHTTVTFTGGHSMVVLE